jgi:hypothetical protein
MRPRRRVRVRRGVALVEVVVALVMLGVAVTGLAGMTLWAGRRAAVSNVQNLRYAAEVRLIDQLTVLPFDSLPSRAGCREVNEPPFPHTWCLILTDVTPKHRRLTLVMRPTSPLVRPDTIEFERTKGVPYNPVS